VAYRHSVDANYLSYGANYPGAMNTEYAAKDTAGLTSAGLGPRQPTAEEVLIEAVGAIVAAQRRLDEMETDVKPETTAAPAPVGIIALTLHCRQQAIMLDQAVMRLAERLGRL